MPPERPPRRKPVREPSRRTRSGCGFPVAASRASEVAEPAWKGWVNGIPVLNFGPWKMGVPIFSAKLAISLEAYTVSAGMFKAVDNWESYIASSSSGNDNWTGCFFQ